MFNLAMAPIVLVIGAAIVEFIWPTPILPRRPEPRLGDGIKKLIDEHDQEQLRNTRLGVGR